MLCIAYFHAYLQTCRLEKKQTQTLANFWRLWKKEVNYKVKTPLLRIHCFKQSQLQAEGLLRESSSVSRRKQVVTKILGVQNI